MTAFNAVRFRVKPGQDQAFLDAHKKIHADWPGLRHVNIIKTGDRSYCIIAEWDGMDALAKARPNEIAYSSPGVGNTGHLAAALFESLAKVKTIHVPYKGTAPAVIAVLSGETQLTWSSIPAILPHVRAGRARALGVGNTKRLPSLPDFPTVAEAGVPGFECVAWGGLIGPANMPRDIVLRLSKETVATLNQKDVIDRTLSEGTVPAPSGPDEFLAYMKSELKKWGEVVKIAGIKPE